MGFRLTLEYPHNRVDERLNLRRLAEPPRAPGAADGGSLSVPSWCIF